MSARWRYILQEATVGLRRNMMMTFAVILSIAVSLTLLGASLLLRSQVSLTAGTWYESIEVSIFLCDGRICASITDEQREQLEEDLTSDPVVESVIYESKQEAYERFREQFADTPELVDSVSPDILPAAFRVKLKDPELYAVVRDRFEARVGVEEIVDQRETLDDFLRLANVIRDSAFRVALIQLLAASVLIGNTIRVAAFARREQTSIMKLVGASNWYIRLPFILEGIIAGLAGAVVSWGLLLIAVPRLSASLRANIDFVPFIGFSDALAVGPVLLGTGILIASVSSVLALRRFLDV